MPTDRNALSWTSAQVLSDVRRKASLPTTSTDWTDAVILREATDVLWSFASWALSQGGEGRMLASLDRPITTALTGPFASGNEVLLPPLAIASTVETVTWTSAEGAVQSRLTRIDAAEEATFTTPRSEGSPALYALVGERIRLYPRPSTGGFLRITYQRRHPELVPDAVASGVNNITGMAAASATTTTLTEAYAHLAYYGVGDTMELISGQYPYAPVATNLEITALPTGTSVTVAAPLAQLQLWDASSSLHNRFVRAGQSPFVSMPLELRACVHEKTAANILRVMGDVQGSQAAEVAAQQELARVMQMLSPRSKRDKPRAVNPYSHMRLKLGRF